MNNSLHGSLLAPLNALRTGLLGLAILVTGLAAPAAFAAGTDTPDSAEKIQPALIGSQAPNASVVTLNGTATNLHDIVLGKKSVLIFYRGGW